MTACKRSKNRREHEKAELLAHLRNFSERSTWGKTRLSRELGVSITSVDRWLDGHNQILNRFDVQNSSVFGAAGANGCYGSTGLGVNRHWCSRLIVRDTGKSTPRATCI